MTNVIPQIIDVVSCDKHNKKCGEPCYIIPAEFSNKNNVGVCNFRAKCFGFRGKISKESLQKKAGYR